MSAAQRTAAVLGSPIEHSLSPTLHNAAYADLALPWSYTAIECDASRLPGLLAELDDAFVGLSLTMPLKRAVIAHCDEFSGLVTDVGAANTITVDGVGPFRRLRADNTDVGGIAGALADGGGIRGSVVILGAGGTAAAAVAAVRELGVRDVLVVVRDATRADGLGAAAKRLGVAVQLVQWPGIDAIAGAEVVISTVPPAAATEFVAAVSSGQVVFDVLYSPWPTPLVRAASKVGARVIDGLELLVRQAALQIELWSGRRAPMGAMRAAGEAALRQRAGGSAG